MDKTIYIHYPPGARGDFLASILFDSFKPKDHGAVTRPVGHKYKNLHVIEDYSFLNLPNIVSIRIATGVVTNGKWNGNSIDPSLQIVWNWMSKMPGHFDRNPHYMTMELPERYYHCARFFLMEDIKSDVYKYDYRVEYNNLNNIEYLNNLRISIMGTDIREDTQELMVDNLNIQKHWSECYDGKLIGQVQRLIDSELESGVFLGPEWDHTPMLDKLESF
jgi:hypothetical protein